MQTETTAFDWIRWYAAIPGIPADWGKSPTVLTLRPERPSARPDEAEPLPKAA